MATKKKAPKKPARPKPVSLKLRSVAPGLTVNDVHASLAWYRDVLGVKAGEKWEVDGQLRGVELFAGDVTFMIGQDDWKKGRDRIKGQGVRLYFETKQDIDRIAASVKANGGTLTQEPTDNPWGMRDFSLDDPDGYKLTIGAKLKKKKKR
jgi:uncharacterized glyoxalase superfamily protein PhnB